VTAIRIRWQSFVDEATNAPYLARLQEHLTAAASEGTVVEVVGMSPPARDFGRLSEFRCSIAAVANAIDAETDGCDAFVFGHFQEPGLYEARAACGIPVVGIGESSLLWAAHLGRRLGLVSIDSAFTVIHLEQVERYGLGSRIVGIGAMEAQVEDFEGAFAGDVASRQALIDAFEQEGRTLIALGADVLVVAGGLFGLLIASERGMSVDGVPVVNCTAVGLAWAEMDVRLHRMTGIVASQGPSFRLAPDRARGDFLSR
jgi:allantoin racemase